MIQIATLWLCMGLAVIAALVVLGSLILGAWPVFKFALAVAIFFAAAARMIAPSVIYYNEARRNDQDWRDAYKF